MPPNNLNTYRRVTSRKGILDFFFEAVYKRENPHKISDCNYNKAIDTAYLPSLYLPASSLVASPVRRKHGMQEEHNHKFESGLVLEQF